jgi:hypothetical protein
MGILDDGNSSNKFKELITYNKKTKRVVINAPNGLNILGNVYVTGTIETSIPCSHGIQGEQGIPGLQGLRGEQGLNGIPGLSGLNGEQGIPGLPGQQGIPGLKGEQGIQGLKGDSGIFSGILTFPGKDTKGDYTFEVSEPDVFGNDSLIIKKNGKCLLSISNETATIEPPILNEPIRVNSIKIGNTLLDEETLLKLLKLLN